MAVPRIRPLLLLSCTLISIAACARSPQSTSAPAAAKDGRAAESDAQVVNPLRMPGADLGAKVNAAFAAMPASGGTVRVPAGTYDYDIPIRLTRAGQHLACDAGAVLHYIGGNDAIIMDPSAGPDLNLSIDGEGGCHLVGNAAAENGVHLMPGNTFTIRGMRIRGFKNGIELSGANNVQILMNVISNNGHGIDLVTVPHYAPNAVHVSGNELSGNDWGVYSHNGHVPATRALGNVYRDGVFEGNRLGDLFLGWDAHTLVEGNYFESAGVAVGAGLGGDNVFDIHVTRNYFTVNGPAGYRSEVELGYGIGFFVEGNYEEGPAAPVGSGCTVNAIPGPHGGTVGVVLQNAFLRASEGKISAHEFCYQGSPNIPSGVLGATRIPGDLDLAGDVHAKGGALSGPLQIGHGVVSSTDTAVHAGESCSAEGTLLIATPPGHAAGLFFCTSGHWQAAVMPRP
jgi:hypothetical protein